MSLYVASLLVFGIPVNVRTIDVPVTQYDPDTGVPYQSKRLQRTIVSDDLNAVFPEYLIERYEDVLHRVGEIGFFEHSEDATNKVFGVIVTTTRFDSPMSRVYDSDLRAAKSRLEPVLEEHDIYDEPALYLLTHVS
jgi:hypothetical protein